MKKYRLIIIILAFGFILFLLYPSGKLGPVKNVFYIGMKPFSLTGSFIADKVSSVFQNLIHLGSLSRENKRLIKENLELQSKLSLLNETQHENEVLKKEIGFYNDRKDLNLLPANVIGRSVTGYLKSVVIDRGSKDGLKQGQAIVSDGFLVGTIKNVLENTSEVTLVTDYNSLIPVTLQDSRGTGLLRGGLTGLVVEDIPLNITIKENEQIVSSGLGGDMPFGIQIGKVKEVISKKGEIFQKVAIDSPIQIYFLEFVFVVQ